MAKATGAKRFQGAAVTKKESELDPVDKLSRDLSEQAEGPRGTQGEPPAPLPTPPTITAEQLEQQIDDAVAQAVAVREAELLERFTAGRRVTPEAITAAQQRHSTKMGASADRARKKAEQSKEGRDWGQYFKLLDMVEYAPVAVRMLQFRREFQSGLLYPVILEQDANRVVIQSYVYTNAEDFEPLRGADGQPLLNSYGQVLPGGKIAATDIKMVSTKNQAGALETAITQAHGRALAGYGYSIQAGVASAEEVEAAQREEERAEREAKKSEAKKSGAKQDSGSGAGAQGSLPASEPSPPPPPVKQQQGTPQDLADWHQSLALLLERRAGVIDGAKVRDYFGKISDMDMETVQRVGKLLKDIKTRDDADAFWDRQADAACTSWVSWPGASPQGRAIAYLTAVLQRHEAMDSPDAKAIQKAQQGIISIDPFGDTPVETLVQSALDKLAGSVELPAIDPPTEG